MSRLRLTLACGAYDRTLALADGRVRVKGVDLDYIALPPEDLFPRMLKFQEFDVSEMSLSHYVMTLSSRKQPFVAIPVFTSRVFRHSGIFVNKNSGIEKPSDLEGKRVGTPVYEMTACVWIRGILEEHYGVPASSVTYYVGGLEKPERRSIGHLRLPARFKVNTIGPDQYLSAMLDDGKIDALYTAPAPSCFNRRSKSVRRLFDDFLNEEKRYFAATGIFPIMHTVVIRREVYEKNRRIARNLYDAFLRAQRITYDELNQLGVLKTMLPWLPGVLEETRRQMGRDFWPYGLRKNNKTLKTFLRYSFQQGLVKRLLDPKEFFVPETTEL